ncbi:efflux RND transporter permease subunit [candidate division KSB1 bacterium]|nr:efflux RND transporter permease subunit [candidate division KSB1 bacterium]
MRIVSFSINRKVTVSMIFLASVVFGMIAFDRLALDLLPDISYPTITVRTEYTGTAPAEIENLISRPIEESVGVINGVVRVSSISRPGVSDVIVEFDWDTNMDFASLDVREKLDLLNLPNDAEQPILLRYDPALEPILRIGLFGDQNLISMRLFAEKSIKQDLESLEGVASVQIIGGLEEEIHIEINQNRMSNLNIPISLVSNRLAQENINLTGGTLTEGDMEYIVRTINQFRTVEEINEIIVRRVEGANILLKDIGSAYKSFKERKIITRISGLECVQIEIFKEADANTVKVAKMVKEKIASLSENLSRSRSNLKLEIITDQSRFIKQSIDDVLLSAIIGGILAMIVLFYFLKDVLSTSIISLAIPISVVVTFFLMFLSNVSLNIMSLGGLALGIGMLVDNAIVVLESIDRYKKKGDSPPEAALKGTTEVGKAVIASTLTTIFVFVPIIFVEGIAGKLFADQALTVTFSLMASLFVALTLIPMLSSLRGSSEELEEIPITQTDISKKIIGLVESFLAIISRTVKTIFIWIGRVLNLILTPIFWLFDLFFNRIFNAYPGVLHWSLNHRLVVISLAFGLMALTLIGYRFIGSELIPEISQGEFMAEIKLSSGTPLEETDELMTNMSAIAKQDENIQEIFLTSGATSKQAASAGQERENIGELYIRLIEGSSRETEEAVINNLRKLWQDFPGLDVKFSRPTFFSFKAPIEIEIKGYNLKALEDISKDLAERMRKIPGLVDVKTSLEGGNPEIQIAFNRERLASLGTDVASVAQLIRDQVQGTIATEFSRLDRRIDVRVRAQENDRNTLDALRRLIINPTDNVNVPLYSIAAINVEKGPSEIRRIDQERVALVFANLENLDLSSAADEIQNIIDSMTLPEQFTISIGGQNKEMSVSFDSMRFAILLAIFLVYLVMASQFESLLHPFVIMFTIPFGLIGVILILLLTNTTISVVVLIGVIMLAGIVVNNAIILVDYINNLRRTKGLAKTDAIKEACEVRLRPILMTTTTTILALLPMAIGFGEGSELRAPMAIAVIGGLALSTMLTLILIPTVYSLVQFKELPIVEV